MGYGDDVLASGFARGARERGKRIAFGDGKRIIWGPWSEEIFRNNPNVAKPGTELSSDIEWVDFYKGHRKYNTLGHKRWIWNMAFRPVPGEIYFDVAEFAFSRQFGEGYILIEPNVPQEKSVAINKQWPIERFQAVADALSKWRVIQLRYPKAKYLLQGVTFVDTANFRQALAVLSNAALFIGGEGGMHHGAAALNVPGVVIFGGFIPPQVTGYDMHINLTGGDVIACGSHYKCDHCARALNAISVEDVLLAAAHHFEKAA